MAKVIKKAQNGKQLSEIKKDNTRSVKVIPEYKKIDYKYLGKSEDIKGKPTSKDSADYRAGFRHGDKQITRSSVKPLGFHKENYKPGLEWVGISPRFNEGFSEGKDVALKNKTKMKTGGMLKRADGSYSKRGLWDNIRAAKGSGKKPTAAMLKQEKKIKAKTKK
jgi:hypothetical protein